MVLTMDDDDKIVAMRGDKAQPMSKGYACFKGCRPKRRTMAPSVC